MRRDLTGMGRRYGYSHQSLLDYARADRIILEGALTEVVLARQDGLAVREGSEALDFEDG